MGTILDVAISMVFVFLLFSIIVSGAAEIIQLIRRKRAHFLHESLDEVFNDRLNKNYTHLLYIHPLLDRLKEKDSTYPHYIPAVTFADALIDVIRNDDKLPVFKFNKETRQFDVKHPDFTAEHCGDEKAKGAGVVKDFREAVEKMQESDLKQLLRTMTFGVCTYDELRDSITQWFNDYMGATSTWYKRYVTKLLFTIGVIVAVGFNIDSIHLARELYKNKFLRERVVESAEQYIRENKAPLVTADGSGFTQAPSDISRDSLLQIQLKSIEQAYGEAGFLELPIGWSVREIVGEKYDTHYKALPIWEKSLHFAGYLLWYIIRSLLGWFITAAALSYGADYWFNILSKFINIRTSVKPKQ